MRDTSGYEVTTLRPSNKGRRSRKLSLTRAHKLHGVKYYTSMPPREVTAQRFDQFK